MVTNNLVKIKVIGIGGGGNNAVHSMHHEGFENVEFINLNTDEQVIENSELQNKLVLGKTNKGKGAGADPEKGKKAAIESEEEIRNLLKDGELIILAAGMGGGTGTGASPIIGKIAKEQGALTIAVVTTPFKFEGTKRMKNAEDGINELRKNVDSIIVISNEKLLKQFGTVSINDSFLYADKVLKQTVRTITDLISKKSRINLDFADVVTVMKEKGNALIGMGRANGSDRAVKAAIYAISSPILDSTIKGAKEAIINVAGKDNSITLHEIELIMETIRNAAGEDVNIIFGTSNDEKIGNDIQVSIIATGINHEHKSSEEEKQLEVKRTIESLEVKYEDDATREILTNKPYEMDSFSITQEIKAHHTISFNVLEDNEKYDDDELPSFLRNK